MKNQFFDTEKPCVYFDTSSKGTNGMSKKQSHLMQKRREETL